jgi:NitT/TauT family transport system permease protein
VFTLTYATWAAKSERAGRLLVPILDILQSVPILGFVSITFVFFMSLAPGRVLGAEFAAIFAIFTSQAWNMAFSFYQSLRTVPAELSEAADSFRLSPWMRFWQLEVPFGLPALVWNMMMSMSGGWFFVVASEAFTVGKTTVALPGVGSYIALAIAQKNLVAIAWAIGTMLVVILLYDQLLFRPLVAWSDRFRVEQEPGVRVPDSWALTMMRRSRLIQAGKLAFRAAVLSTSRAVKLNELTASSTVNAPRRSFDLLWVTAVAVLVVLGLWHIVWSLLTHTPIHEAVQVCGLAVLTMLRVFILILLASLVWVPIGIWVGLRPRATEIVQPIAQFMAAFPTNLLFPIAVYGVVTWRLNPNVWLSPLMILGTQWYILFNVIAGASALPAELRYAAENFGVKGWLWWRKVALPGVLPFYVTGAITASGGSWNAAQAAEIVSWGDTQIQAKGLGAYIADATTAGDYHRIVLGIAVMCLFVVVINRLFWRPLYYFAERKYRLT